MSGETIGSNGDGKGMKAVKVWMCRKLAAMLALMMLVSALLPAAVGEGEALSNAGCAVGDIVVFGRYRQSMNASDNQEPLQWIVLAAEEERVLLLSLDAIDRKLFHEGLDTYTEPSWAESTLRGWLNTDFIYSAFSAQERKALLSTELDNSGSGAAAARDCVFLLSAEEAAAYLPSEAQRAASLSDYAQGIKDGGSARA